MMKTCLIVSAQTATNRLRISNWLVIDDVVSGVCCSVCVGVCEQSWWALKQWNVAYIKPSVCVFALSNSLQFRSGRARCSESVAKAGVFRSKRLCGFKVRERERGGCWRKATTEKKREQRGGWGWMMSGLFPLWPPVLGLLSQLLLTTPFLSPESYGSCPEFSWCAELWVEQMGFGTSTPSSVSPELRESDRHREEEHGIRAQR